MAKKPNLLYIFADQWRRDAVGMANADEVITKNIDAFGQKSVYFTNAVSTFPLCSPHRASLLTGKHPLSTGVFTNCKTKLPMRLKDDEICIGQVLSDNGYDTGYIGKWHLDEPEINNNPCPASKATAWDAYTPKGIRRHGFDFWHSYGACDEHLSPHYWSDSEQSTKVSKWSVEYETEVAIDYIRKHNTDKPFSLFVSWNPPHSPYDQVPQKYFDMYKDRDIKLKDNVITENIHHHTYEPANCTSDELKIITKQYFAAVSGLDDNFGKLIDVLTEQNLLDNTIVVISADHGDMLGSHALMAKHVWYEESIGIPCIIGGNGMKKSVCNTVFGSPDIMPTLLGMMDIPIPTTVEGIDISNCVISGEDNDEKLCFLSACPGREVFLEEFKNAGKNPMDFGWRGVRSQNYTYIIDVSYNVTPTLKRYLFDLKNDPMQINPLIIQDPSNNEIAAVMEQQCIGWMKQQQDGFLLQLQRSYETEK